MSNPNRVVAGRLMKEKLDPAIDAKFIVRRDSDEESTYAVVTAKVPEALVTEATFLAALKTAVTAWVVKASEGQAAWADSGDDFNIGDLSNHFGSSQLEAELRRVGDLTVDVHSVDYTCTSWAFDTALVEEDPA